MGCRRTFQSEGSQGETLSSERNLCPSLKSMQLIVKPKLQMRPVLPCTNRWLRHRHVQCWEKGTSSIFAWSPPIRQPKCFPFSLCWLTKSCLEIKFRLLIRNDKGETDKRMIQRCSNRTAATQIWVHCLLHRIKQPLTMHYIQSQCCVSQWFLRPPLLIWKDIKTKSQWASYISFAKQIFS